MNVFLVIGLIAALVCICLFVDALSKGVDKFSPYAAAVCLMAIAYVLWFLQAFLGGTL